MSQVELASRELSISLALLEYWFDNHDDDSYDQRGHRAGNLEAVGRPRGNEIR
ncbi:hypothetical protein [Leptolyngbya sp. GGD]|uniref:hypothetical protein n=1 Tax=Leptolyngbya sp. GGD TaxID=2997907 RepID=UPI00227A2333|nr:hypothetical protein [Leptolyngbya sp. GGD]MCY6493397.1 hypothetical protein [Leptolyngbya sp. GGD]